MNLSTDVYITVFKKSWHKKLPKFLQGIFGAKESVIEVCSVEQYNQAVETLDPNLCEIVCFSTFSLGETHIPTNTIKES